MASRRPSSPAAPAAAASADASAAAPAPPAAAAGDDHGARKRPHDDEAAALPPSPPPHAPPAPPLAAPFRGPAADSRLGELFLDIVSLVSANGFALDARPTRFLCGLTLREGARRADGSLDRAGFAGGPADMIRRALEAQAPWLRAARAAPREDARLHGASCTRTTSLIRAAAAGDERHVRELLAAGAPLRCVDGSRWTALHHASLQGSAQVVAALLEADEAGPTIDAQNGKGNTALLFASMLGYEGAVSLLLARGARQELQNENGDTALHWAAYKGHAGVVEQLCAAPVAAAAVALRTKNGCTPLVLAVSDGGGGERLVSALLEADAVGATVNSQTNSGDSALIEASRKGHEGAVRLLLLARGARQELQNDGGMTALHYAAWTAHAGVVELLCAATGAAAALALRTKVGLTPLALAVHAGQAACASVLRAHGAS